jgi:tellurite resistance protein TehA-like permease
MFNYFSGTIYIVNLIIFFVLVGIFFLAGLKLANKTIKDKEKHKKKYYSIALSCPTGFIIGFFIIDSMPYLVNKYSEFRLPYTILAHWITITLVGIILSLIISFYIIKSEGSKDRNNIK